MTKQRSNILDVEYWLKEKASDVFVLVRRKESKISDIETELLKTTLQEE